MSARRNAFKSDPNYTRKTTGKDTARARMRTLERRTVRTLKYAPAATDDFTAGSDR